VRDRKPPAKQLRTNPACAGLMTRLACAYARNAGLELPPLLRRVGLTVRQIQDENLLVPVKTQIDCLNALARALDDRLLGFHVTLDMELRRIGFLYYAAASSDVLASALQGIVRYSAILNEGIKLKVDCGETLRVGFVYAGVSRLSDRHQIEAWTGVIVRCCRDITGRDLQPIAVRIMHPRIPESGALDNFFGCAVEFGADCDEVVFAADAGKLPIVNADRYLHRLVTGYGEDFLSRRKWRSGGIRTDVENAIAALLPHGSTQLANVARKLGLTPRTLRRKLTAEGVTFARVLEDLRVALAQHYLAEQDLPISRIAWLLGYTEVSAFSHAFRRWTGRTPRADRSRRQRPRSTPQHRRRQVAR
jgi:AraC-like DNA-binding protein